MKKLTPKNVNLLVWIVLIAGLIISFCGVPKEKSTLTVNGVVIMCVALVFRFIFYRCPYCGKYLGRDTGQYCPYCRGNVNEQ